MTQTPNLTVPNNRRAFMELSLRAMSSMALAGIFLAPTQPLAQPRKRTPARKALVLYHSRSGNTRTVANQIREAVGGDLIEIQTVQPYPDNYDAVVAQNAHEQRINYLPPVRTTIDNIRDYDVVFIGSPIWNVRLTPPVRSFLAQHDLSGKIIAPFVTYKVSGLGRARKDIQELCARSTIVHGLAVLGDEAGKARPAVLKWLARVNA